MYNTIVKNSRAPDQREKDYSSENLLKKPASGILKDFAIESNNVQMSNYFFIMNRFS
jgi:hypothetical protein